MNYSIVLYLIVGLVHILTCYIRLDYRFLSKDKGHTKGKACKRAPLTKTYIHTYSYKYKIKHTAKT